MIRNYRMNNEVKEYMIKNSVKKINALIISLSILILFTSQSLWGLVQIPEINLIDKQHIWKSFSDAIISQYNGDLNIVVVTTHKDKIWSRAFLPTQVTSPVNSSVLLTFNYASQSSNPNATFLAEIRDNTSKFLWSSSLNDTNGHLSAKTFTLPSNIVNRPVEFRLYIITNSPGEHILTVKKAGITIFNATK
jgi:hypothetical protein